MDAAQEHARELARARWGNAKVTRAAQLVIDRAAELDEVTRARLHLATADEGDVDDD